MAEEAFNYVVSIFGIDGIPLRTTSQGAKALMKSFHEEPNMEKLLLEAVDAGTPFKNKLVSVTALFPRPKIQQVVVTKKAEKPAKSVVRKRVVRKRVVRKPITDHIKKTTKRS